MNALNLNNKRIAKNTLMLYVRMLITMLVSLYTVRVLLQELGLMDYGIYNLVSGLVTFFSFISITMSSATQRYLSFSLGKKDKISFQKIFSMNVLIYGAGEAGTQIADYCINSDVYNLVAFIDDDPNLHQKKLNNRKVSQL